MVVVRERVVGGGEGCLPEVINLHQKSNNVKMSFQHLQLSEAVFGLFLSDAQHGASLQKQEGGRREESVRQMGCGAPPHRQTGWRLWRQDTEQFGTTSLLLS